MGSVKKVQKVQRPFRIRMMEQQRATDANKLAIRELELCIAARRDAKEYGDANPAAREQLLKTADLHCQKSREHQEEANEWQRKADKAEERRREPLLRKLFRGLFSWRW